MQSIRFQMLKKERQALIMKQVHLHNRVLSADLEELLGVSEDTIRRDLNELSEAGELVKVHGGALSKSYHYEYSNDNTYALLEKQLIAKKAIKLIEDGMFVLVGGGTTVREIIKALPPQLSATFFTISLTTALQLCEHPNIEVIFLGGKLIKNSQISVGGEVIARLSEISADLCIMGINGVDYESITEFDTEVVQVKKAMIKASKRTAVVTISEKLGSTQRLRVSAMSDIDYLLTELSPEDDLLSSYQHRDFRVL